MKTRTLKRRAITCAIFLALYFAFLFWVKSWWGLIVVPFIFDVYITKLIPWTWWKKTKNPALRTLLGWIDAIVFALVAVYFVNQFFVQNYQIPSSSLEKSLLVGDYLLVSKMSYGARIPQTPLYMPLTQNTMPIIGGKSYLEKPQWEYRRTSGFGAPQRGDIVVFNFPAGDTVATNFSTMDIYTIAYEVGRQYLALEGVQPNDTMSLAEEWQYYDKAYRAGMDYIRNNPAQYGEIITHPVDKRENYVKRCVAIAGDDLMIKNGDVYVNGKKQALPREAQFAYKVWTTDFLSEYLLDDLDISHEDAANYDTTEGMYILPLTNHAYKKLKSMTGLVKKIKRLTDQDDMVRVYPQNRQTGWGRDNYGPVHLPRKGETVKLSLGNLAFYSRCITAYEGNTLAVKDTTIYINGRVATSYTFKMDYYWMMGDNRHNSLDSRYWGPVPEDHVVGTPLIVWLSLNKDKGWLDGKIRWNRFFKIVSHIK